MRFDRERAREVLYETDTTVAHWADDVLDRLEECVLPDVAEDLKVAQWKEYLDAKERLSKIGALLDSLHTPASPPGMYEIEDLEELIRAILDE